MGIKRVRAMRSIHGQIAKGLRMEEGRRKAEKRVSERFCRSETQEL